MLEGWYYLHENGSLIYKREVGGTAADLRESDLVRHFWPLDPTHRSYAWNILVEAAALGADPERIKELATKWKCDDEDAAHYAQFAGCKLTRDGASWCATRNDFVDLQQSPAGFGDSALEAMAALAKALKFVPSKMWGPSFKDLLDVRPHIAAFKAGEARYHNDELRPHGDACGCDECEGYLWARAHDQKNQPPATPAER